MTSSELWRHCYNCSYLRPLRRPDRRKSGSSSCCFWTWCECTPCQEGLISSSWLLINIHTDGSFPYALNTHYVVIRLSFDNLCGVLLILHWKLLCKTGCIWHYITVGYKLLVGFTVGPTSVTLLILMLFDEFFCVMTLSANKAWLLTLDYNVAIIAQ